MSNIRKTGLVSLFVSALCLVTWANSFAAPSMEFGFKGGLSMAKLTGSDLKQKENIAEDLGGGFTLVGTTSDGIDGTKSGFLGGGYAMVHVNESFGIRLEALYASKGAKGDVTGDLTVFDPSLTAVGSATATGDNTLTLNYFEIPILAVASMSSGNAGRFDVFAGPSFAFLTTAEAETKVTTTVTVTGVGSETATEEATADIKDSVKGMDFGGVLGAGYTWKFTSMFAFLEARWNIGFSKIDDSPGSTSDVKNSAFGISAGLGFPVSLGGK